MSDEPYTLVQLRLAERKKKAEIKKLNRRLSKEALTQTERATLKAKRDKLAADVTSLNSRASTAKKAKEKPSAPKATESDSRVGAHRDRRNPLKKVMSPLPGKGRRARGR